MLNRLLRIHFKFETQVCFLFATRGALSRIACGTIATGLLDFEACMADTRLFEEIDRKMRELLAQSPARDLEKNLRALLTSAFGRRELVTREEFDVQREVLARTRAMLADLEAKLAELEKNLKAEGRRQKAE